MSGSFVPQPVWQRQSEAGWAWERSSSWACCAAHLLLTCCCVLLPWRCCCAVVTCCCGICGSCMLLSCSLCAAEGPWQQWLGLGEQSKGTPSSPGWGWYLGSPKLQILYSTPQQEQWSCTWSQAHLPVLIPTSCWWPGWWLSQHPLSNVTPFLQHIPKYKAAYGENNSAAVERGRSDRFPNHLPNPTASAAEEAHRAYTSILFT